MGRDDVDIDADIFCIERKSPMQGACEFSMGLLSLVVAVTVLDVAIHSLGAPCLFLSSLL
jgi:hypothetical protein